jgi:hypothetical protein
MSKKKVQTEEDTKETTPVTETVHLKVRAALVTPERTYEQGEVIEVSAEEAAYFYREYASYFEVVNDVQKDE